MSRLQLGPHAVIGEALIAAYGEPHRHYHSWTHIEASLDLLEQHAGSAQVRPDVEVAIWFHDAIYRPLLGRSETLSARWASSFLNSVGLHAAADRVADLILVTALDRPAKTPDERLMADIDLAILGASAESYAVYARSIRQEYALVPWFIFRRRRARLLLTLLERARIFQTEALRHLEPNARENLRAELKRLV